MTLFEEQFHAQSLGAEGLQVQAPYRLQEPTNMLSYRSLHTPFIFFYNFRLGSRTQFVSLVRARKYGIRCSTTFPGQDRTLINYRGSVTVWYVVTFN